MKIGVIGGSGLDSIDTLVVSHRESINTNYGDASAPISFGRLAEKEIYFLPRHGSEHTIAPHKINYRANMAALHKLGVTHIISIAAVGGITASMAPVKLVFPDQIVDYTYGREHTYSDGAYSDVTHVDFSYPYDEFLRGALIESADTLKLSYESRATYGATQGPRLETAAEIKRMERDGCDIVGMTGMPEAVLARELDMAYSHCAFVVNWAAGKGDGSVVSMEEIHHNLIDGAETVKTLLTTALPSIMRAG